MRKSLCLSAIATALLLTGCTLAPRYEQPQAPVAEAWPQDSATANAKLITEGLANWGDFFTDQRLITLIQTGLENNRDLRVAFYNVEQARALYNVSRSELLPSVAVAADEAAARSLVGTRTTTVSHQYTASAMASYELDLFGRIRSLNEQALQVYFQTEAAQRTAQMTVICEIAQTWLSLGAAKTQLKLSSDTYESQTESYRLIKHSFDLGAASQLDVQQAAQTVASAKAAVAQYDRAVSQYRNALTLLVGGSLDPKLEPDGLEPATVAVVSAQSNIPSEVLLNRPDIAAAEAELKAANAYIGVARAAFFPSISLTGALGSSSLELSDMFKSGSRVWNWAPQVTLPIFAGGSNISNLRAAEAARKAALANYEGAIQSAFREVADALATEGTVERELEAQKELATAAAESYRLAQERYRNGVDSFLEVLDSQRTNFTAQQALISARLARSASLITLYKALGGASQPTS